MGASRKSSIDTQHRERLCAHVQRFLAAHLQGGEDLCVGLSGGLDSIVLLDVLVRLRAPLGLRLSALHVNHGLSANATVWEEFCSRACEGRGVALSIERVHIGAARGLGVEAAARRARFGAFARRRADYMLLAHHLDDQAETVLLRLLRGAGVRGLAAMRPLQIVGHANTHNRIALLRPFLDIDRAILHGYASKNGLDWIEDESNRELRFDRNFLRQEIFPKIAQRFPHYRVSFARAAQHLAQAGDLLDTGAAADAAACADGARLRLAALNTLPPPRAAHVLRAFVRAQADVALDTRQTRELLRQLQTARADAQIEFRYAGRVLRAWRGELQRVPDAANAPFGTQASPLCVTWNGEEELALPAPYGSVRFQRQLGAGLSAAKLAGREVSVRPRRGGERIRLHTQARTRTLKNLLQEAHMPLWQRERLPLVFVGEELACAPGIGVAAQFQAGAAEAGVVIVWRQGTTA